ncbi:phage integrase N-terminal SAM-like domain-containing protein [Leptolyngbya ectocarpi]|uniref:phage integrase N-terminal SAM-like domain-containing protein n=1 Tax=Leptolyngbya ectocarpi TaxID=1202 RepID=UPI001D14F5E8|nr:phage integrase N-terminal SAM-like domain-containing protein [Leptolyngbya ectocarpi]
MSSPEPRPRKLLDQVRDAIRLRHYSYRTEETYVQWIRRYILFHNKRHPKDMGIPEIEAFLTHLAVNKLWGPLQFRDLRLNNVLDQPGFDSAQPSSFER